MQIHRGKQNKPPRIMLYGVEGIGKSSWAAAAPNPIFLPTEDGIGQIDCASVPLIKTLPVMLNALESIRRDPQGFKTVVIDSLDWLERQVWKATCDRFGGGNIEKVDGGYQKGFSHCLDEWNKVIAALTKLREEHGMIIILIAHSKVEKFEDPESVTYDRYSPKLHKHATALICEWCDCVLFASTEFRVDTETLAFNKTRGIAKEGVGAPGGRRIIRAVSGPSAIAKNRFNLPPVMDLSWPVFIKEVAANI